ncbi:DUF3265 domain-containing protein [Vibrio cholerae]|nr:DUF3265 domain-containing protein [Vibrio cholerae]TQP10530.1 DUF3265 domain-containing protein [Vibrio cholerae]TQP18186.1 DUF3265 domain-containing protein [Vibrio cholerae]TQP50497.1 DUF3265 domain-containing protein [Vibrio cholerae]
MSRLLCIHSQAGVAQTCITNCLRGIRNAWHFYYALVFVVTVSCGKLVVALAAP